MAKQREAQQAVSAKILAMESKLLSGGNIIDETNEQRHELETRRKELAEQKVGLFSVPIHNIRGNSRRELKISVTQIVAESACWCFFINLIHS